MKQASHVNRGSIHSLYTERVGNENGPDILFIHGGPGLGFSDRDKQFFDFDKCNVLFFDQRGSGRSLPSGECKENTTADLLEDIDFLIEHFKLKNVILFAGSWGATLALAYAIKYPQKIKALILRGLFMASKAERKYFEKGGAKIDFPKQWARFKSKVRTENDEEVMHEYFSEILDSKENQLELSYEFQFYNASMGGQNLSEEEIKQNLLSKDHLSHSKIFSHYSINDFFLEDEWIQKNIHKIKSLPIKIVHGVNDRLTKINVSEDLAAKHNNIVLIKTNGGHSSFDPENSKALINQIENCLNNKKWSN